MAKTKQPGGVLAQHEVDVGVGDPFFLNRRERCLDAVRMRHVGALAEVRRNHDALCAKLFRGLRDVLGVDLRPVREEGQRRVRPGQELQEADLDHRAHVNDLLGLRHGEARHIGQAVRDEHVPHAEFATLADHCDDLLGMHVTSGEHEVLAGDDFQNRLHLWRYLTARRHREALGIRPRECLHMLVGLEGRQPNHLAATAVHAMHPLHRARVNAPDRAVEYDATEHLDAGHDLHHQRSAARSLTDMVLEHDAAHAARFSELGYVDVVHVAAEDVRMRVDVKVKDTGGRTDLGWRRRERGLSARIIQRQQSQRRQRHGKCGDSHLCLPRSIECSRGSEVEHCLEQ
jgi:hypothetical protein